MISEYLNKMRVNSATKTLEKNGYTVFKMIYKSQDPQSLIDHRIEKTRKQPEDAL